MELWSVNAFGSDPPRRITVGRGRINTSPTFSPDGRRIAFTSNRLGSVQIYVSDADGTNAEPLINFSFGDQSYRSDPDWSSDGRLIAFLFGWTLFLVLDSGAIATLSVAFSTRYLPYFIPLSPMAPKLVALALITILVIVNILGVRYGAALQNLLMFIKFSAIVAVSLVVFTFVTAHIRAKRPPVADVEAAVSSAGFEIDGRVFDGFTLRFANAAALFSHWLIRIGFLEAWREIVPAVEREAVFAAVAWRLDAALRPGEGLRLDVPFACWSAVRR